MSAVVPMFACPRRRLTSYSDSPASMPSVALAWRNWWNDWRSSFAPTSALDVGLADQTDALGVRMTRVRLLMEGPPDSRLGWHEDAGPGAVHAVHGYESDKVAVPLGVTESLSPDRY
jgi:hypothetical protein